MIYFFIIVSSLYIHINMVILTYNILMYKASLNQTYKKHILTSRVYMYGYLLDFTCMIWFWCPCKCYSLWWHATTLVSFIYTWSLLPAKLYWLLYSDLLTSYLIRALIPYHSHLLLLLNHVVIVVKLCCVEGLMEDRSTPR